MSLTQILCLKMGSIQGGDSLCNVDVVASCKVILRPTFRDRSVGGHAFVFVCCTVVLEYNIPNQVLVYTSWQNLP